MNILRLRKNVLIALLLVSGLLFSGTVFAADEAMTLGAGTKGAGPVAYWSFDESGGPSAHDKTGNGNDGTLNAGATGANTSASQMWTPEGKFGGCLEFDGDDYVDTGYKISAGARSYFLWIKYNSLTGVNGYSLTGTQEVGAYTYIGISDGGQGYFFGGNSGGIFDYTFTTGTWYHVGFTMDGVNTTKIYVNGSQVDTKTYSGDATATLNFLVGRVNSASAHNVSGLIDEVKIYGRALSVDEIRMAYNAGAAAHLGSTTSTSYDPWGGDPPVAWWSLDENSGVDAYDRSGSGNDGTISGATWAHGKVGPALEFDEEDDYVSVPGSFLNAMSEITEEVWIKPITLCEGSRTDWDIFLSRTDPWGYMGFNRSGDDFYPRFRLVVGGVTKLANGTTNITADQWYHIVGTYDGTKMRIYVNGVEEDDIDASGSTATVATALTIGDYATNYHQVSPNAIIDEVKIYDYARTQAQVAWDYNKGKPVGWWKMDEATSGSALGSDNIKDSSGQGNHGSGSGTNIAWTTGRYGGALSFNGTDDYVDCGNDNSLAPATALTVEAWIYTDDITPPNLKGILGNGIYQTSGYNIGLLSSGTVFFATESGGSEYATSTSISTLEGTWIHVVGVSDGSKNRIYINGDLKNTLDPSALTAATGQLYIGDSSQGGMYNFNGSIDDVRIYNYARTADQIMQDYVEGSTAHLGAGTVSRGRSSDTALASCKAIQDSCSQCGDGTYWIDPDGAGGGDPFEAYCDMNTDGGVWTLVYHGLCTSATGTSRTTGNVVELSSDIRFDQMKIEAVNWPYTSTIMTTTETAKMQLTFSGYYQWLHAELHIPNPDVKFHSAADGVQDVQFTSLGYMMQGYGNSWRRILPVFYTQPHDSYMYLGAYAGQGIYGADDWGYGNYNSHMLDTSPTEHGRGLTPVESQEIKVWVREN